jgi:hypothetical protein
MPVCIYLKLKPYVAQWLTSIYGNPVKFPAQSIENAEIVRQLRQVPMFYKPQEYDDSYVAIVLPQSKRRPPEKYNYLTEQAKESLVGLIKNNFDSDLKMSVRRMVCNGVSVTRAVHAWLKDHDIPVEYEETIRTRIRRTVVMYKRKGVNYFHFDAKLELKKIKKKG